MPENEVPEMYINNSVLQPTASHEYYDDASKIFYFAQTRTNKENAAIDEHIATFIVEVDDLDGGDGNEYTIIASSGNLMTANNSAVTIGTTKHTFKGSSSGGLDNITGFITSGNEQCNSLGWARVEASRGVHPYSYQWSTGETVQRVDLAAGIYTVTISDANGEEEEMSVQINPPAPIYDGNGTAVDCYGVPLVTLDISALLEGPYNTQTQEMSTALNTARHLLPGQTPASSLATPTPSGQPYNQPPWDYTGIEGMGWSDANYTPDMVDWLLVSFRTGISKSTEIARTAAIVQKDGCIHFPNRNVLTADMASAVYIVIEHRNHMGIITAQPVPIVDNTLIYDFRSSDSYTGDAGFGQKEVSPNVWAMYTGDSSQENDSPSYDINGSDKAIWEIENGSFDVYVPSDFNLDGDVNGADKTLWIENNGITSRVPR